MPVSVPDTPFRWRTARSIHSYGDRYYHRLLNPRKLVKIGFTSVWQGGTIEELEEENRIEDTLTFSNLGLREMEERDIPEVKTLYTSYMSRFDMVQEWSQEELSHFFLGGKRSPLGVEGGEYTIAGKFMWAYVVEVRGYLAASCSPTSCHTCTGPDNPQDHGFLLLLLSAGHRSRRTGRGVKNYEFRVFGILCYGCGLVTG